ncbi:MAG: sugar ABC transporter ATP-binding protein [Enterocloster aldenensis]
MSVLETKNISKQYPGTLALDHISVSFDSGRIHAFVGKNGSGKSTLLKVFSGAISPTSGDFFLDGTEMRFNSPKDAFEKGIATVYQDLSLVPGLNVAENILLGRMPMKHGMINWKEGQRIAKEILDELQLDIPVDILVKDLSAGNKQMVEIAKAMSFHPKVLQLDEPTSALAKHETQALFSMLRRLKEKDVIIIYVSHKLHELWEIADTCTVLRDGRLIGTEDMDKLERKDVIHMMFGNVEIKKRPEDLKPGNKVVLQVNHLSRKDKFTDISFSLKEGEVLGIAGMLGSGRTELLRGIFGADRYDSGEIIMFGEKIKKATPQLMKKRGLAMIQENRTTEGLVMVHTIKQNICMASTDLISKGIFVKKSLEKEFAQHQIQDLQIKVSSPDDSITSLSGGNAQKVVVGNWLNTNPKIMFFDEPSKGIDVSAKQQIFQIIWDEARKGISSIMVSTELEELLEVCHRIIIMHEGHLVGEIPEKDIGHCGIDDLYAMCM